MMRITLIAMLVLATLSLHLGLDLLADLRNAYTTDLLLDWLIVCLDAAALCLGAGLLVCVAEDIMT
jgi:hypothetical protein